MLKKILPYTGLIAAVLAIVSFVLIMACPVATYTSGDNTTTVAGITAIFGKTETSGSGMIAVTTHLNGGWAGLLGWILLLVAILCLVVAAVLQWVLKKYPQIGSILAIVAGVCAIVAGIFCFLGLVAFNHANPVTIGSTTSYLYNDYKLGAGWVIGAIFGFVAGGVALINCILGIVASLKK